MKFLNKLKRNFLVGIVAILPISVTIWVGVSVFDFIDQVMAPQFQALIGFHIPGLGVITTLVIVTAAGFLTNFVFVQRLGGVLEDFIESVPGLRTIYSAVKQVVMPLIGGGENRAFKQVVSFEWPGNDMWVVGFLVKEPNGGGDPQPDDEVIVFLPTNHLHLGFVIATRRDRLHPIDMNIEDALRTQFSLGVAAPEMSLMGPASMTSASQLIAALEKRNSPAPQ